MTNSLIDEKTLMKAIARALRDSNSNASGIRNIKDYKVQARDFRTRLAYSGFIIRPEVK